jgi:hypothetical protein
MPSNARTLEAATRIGFAARGIMYGLIGYLALRSGRTEDGAGIIHYLDSGAGRLLLLAMAAGFLAYGLWRLLDAWTGASGQGTDTKGMAMRAGAGISGLVHVGLGILALLAGAGSDGGGGGSTEQGAQAALSLPGGSLALLAAAAIFLGTGILQLTKAWKLDFLRHLDSRAARQRWVAWLGRAGYLARGIVFLIIAWFFWRAVTEQNAEQAGGLGEALDTLPSSLRMLVAGGLLLFGLYSLVEARFRRIHAPASML